MQPQVEILQKRKGGCQKQPPKNNPVLLLFIAFDVDIQFHTLIFSRFFCFFTAKIVAEIIAIAVIILRVQIKIFAEIGFILTVAATASVFAFQKFPNAIGGAGDGGSGSDAAHGDGKGVLFHF